MHKENINTWPFTGHKKNDKRIPNNPERAMVLSRTLIQHHKHEVNTTVI
jgi:hypothetical protein